MVASHSLLVEELVKVLAFDLGTGEIPKINTDWRWEHQEEAILSACSSLAIIVIEVGYQIVQFSHFSVKSFSHWIALQVAWKMSPGFIFLLNHHT